MSEKTIFLSPSEAFLLGLVLGEWQEYRDAIGRLSPVYRKVFGHLYETPPTFEQILSKRLGLFVPPSSFFNREEGPHPNEPLDLANSVWLDVRDNVRIGACPTIPLTLFRRDLFSDPFDDLAATWVRVRPNESKHLVNQLLYILHEHIALPEETAILMAICRSYELSNDWPRACELIQNGDLPRQLPQSDKPKLIEAVLGPFLDEYTEEVRSGRLVGQLVAAVDMVGREIKYLTRNHDIFEPLNNDLSTFASTTLIDLYDQYLRDNNAGAADRIKQTPPPRPALRDERPDIFLLDKVRTPVNSLLELPLIQSTPYAVSALEKVFPEGEGYECLFSWYCEVQPNSRTEFLDPPYWVAGFYRNDAFDEDRIQLQQRREVLTWTAIGALLGDMAERDRAFSEEDARKVLPRKLTPFAIDEVGELRDFLPTARKLLALGPSKRGGGEAAVVKTLTTSLEPIMESAFPGKFPVRDGQVVSVLQEAIRESNGDKRLLASHLLHLWRNYRNDAAHMGAERRYSHTEARAVYSLYELAVELHDRVV